MRTLLLAFFLAASPALAIDRAALEKLASGDNDEKVEAIGALLAEGDPEAAAVLAKFAEGEVVVDGKAVEVVVNNRLRSAVADALAALRLLSPERAVRLEAAKALAGGADASMLALVRKALEKETDPDIKPLLDLTAASMEMASGDKQTRLAAIRRLGESNSPNSRTLLAEAATDSDAEIRIAAQKSLREVQGKLAWGERAGLLFAGISLGSILLLAALGLAITYGLMGVINMAHGELIMIGAYTTYVVQNLFKANFPGAFDWYLLAAVPASFVFSALVGMALERLVIRWLYGRPLETLLATWGISLMLIQSVRSIFGAANVQVENPAFMSGGIQAFAGVVLPWSRIGIIVFAVAVLISIWLLLTRTRLGLFVRSVTQNRDMASCVGVPTARVDTWAFGLGSGIAGLAGCALSQIGNVGPDLGQGYIVDSFMVVVFGGVGQLAGTVYAALVLGFANKFLESMSGAVIAKIAVLVFIIFFIQRRPQGLFAVKGRAVDA
ncbi:MAG: urea ABC transporter permease subunit UrtB [Betaproteobacteria bacterium RBG_16_66_20]|nr:MAG: urea ABC transporter permease subunit UrtB [Betaproteobacteria bacterium RBG_16_66_20]